MHEAKDADQRRQQNQAVSKELEKLAAVADGLKRMDSIGQAIQAATPTASAKTREGFAMLKKFMDDTRALYRLAVPEPSALAQAIQTLKAE